MHSPKSLFFTLIITLNFIHICLAQDSLSLVSDLRNLCNTEMEGRKPGTLGHEKAVNYIQNRFISMGLLSTDSLVNDAKSNESLGAKNIGALLKGRSDDFIVVSAHYDHLGFSNDRLYPGCDDNASGVAALFYIAEVLKDSMLSDNIIFVAFDGEETGLIGSKAWLKHLKIPLSNIRININLDMISKNDQNEIYVSGTNHYPEMKRFFKNNEYEKLGINVKFGHDQKNSKLDDWTFSSDHAQFHRQSIPFLYFCVEDHIHYHQPTDTFELTNFSFYYKVVQYLTSLTSTIANDTAKR